MQSATAPRTPLRTAPGWRPHPSRTRPYVSWMRWTPTSDSSGRMFPTWSEVLEVIRDLGYEKPSAARSSVRPPSVVL